MHACMGFIHSLTPHSLLLLQPARVHFVTSPHGRAVSSSVLKSIFSEEVAALTLPERQHLCNVYGTAAAAAALEAVDETLHTLDITDRAAFQQLLYKSREGWLLVYVLVTCVCMYVCFAAGSPLLNAGIVVSHELCN